MHRCEYKTVPLPVPLRVQKKGRRSHGDLVAEAMDEILNAQALEGWEFVRSETVRTQRKAGVFGKLQIIDSVLLVFTRPAEAVSAMIAEAQAQHRPAEPNPAATPTPAPQQAPAAAGSPQHDPFAMPPAPQQAPRPAHSPAPPIQAPIATPRLGAAAKE